MSQKFSVSLDPAALEKVGAAIGRTIQRRPLYIVTRGQVGFYLNTNVCGAPKMPTRHHAGDAGFDLYVSIDTEIPPHAFVDVPTGVHAQLPYGYWARITGRSSTLRKYGLLVNEGIIDTGYTGELFAGVRNLTDLPVFIQQGTALAQLIIHRNHSAEVEPVQLEQYPVSKDGRGDSGFGSTGR